MTTGRAAPKPGTLGIGRRYSHGEIYSLNHDPQRFKQPWLKPKTDIPGLYLSGQDVIPCGVVAAIVGGLPAAINTSGLKGMKLAKDMSMA